MGISDDLFFSFKPTNETVNICSEDGRICPDSFQPAQGFAFDVMERM